ncbi:unnamed protein product [Musa banksii]
MACYCSPFCTLLLVAIFLFASPWIHLPAASTSHEASSAGSPESPIAGSQPPPQPPPPLGGGGRSTVWRPEAARPDGAEPSPQLKKLHL